MAKRELDKADIDAVKPGVVWRINEIIHPWNLVHDKSFGFLFREPKYYSETNPCTTTAPELIIRGYNLIPMITVKTEKEAIEIVMKIKEKKKELTND